MTTLGFLQAVADWLLADPSHVVVAASILAAVTPTPAPDSLQGKLYRIVDLLAVNFLHAKESGASGADTVASAVAKALAAQNAAPAPMQPQPAPAAPAAPQPEGGQ